MSFKRIKKYLLNILYGLPFGMKGADNKIMGSESSDEGVGTTISQEVSNQRVGQDLIKGEVTEAVEELRYRTYKVAEESEKYKYIGNGVAIKDKKTENPNERRIIKFSQDNENVCESVLQGLNQVGGYGMERYRFEIDYEGFVRFKVEKFATRVDVNIDNQTGLIETTLHFSTVPNPYDAASMPFINELSKLLTVTSQYEISRNEIASSIKTFSFATYKPTNEDNFVTYSFVNGGKFKSFKKVGYEYLMTLEWEEYMRVPLNLEAKYYSKSMAEKYEKNEQKEVAVSMVNVERKAYCSVCGKEMELYDHDIQKANGQEPICKDCMKKVMMQQ